MHEAASTLDVGALEPRPRTHGMAAQLRIIGALVRRAANEIGRVPGAAIPGVMAPTIFMIGLSGVFGQAAHLPGFPHVDYRTFIIPVGLMQGAGFTGAATGVNLARDIEQGWFDRLLLAPIPRPTILAGLLVSAALRCLLPVTFLLSVGFAIGVDWPGVGGLALTILLVMGVSAAATCWATALALKFRTQQAAPLMQIGSMASILFTSAYAPKALLSGWLGHVANINPVTNVIEGIRQGFVGSVTWHVTWPALLSVAGLIVVLGAWALRRMATTGA
jgi:ABC-2 type transport system permease protein